MGHKILTLSPGSTSTKVAVFDGAKALFRMNVTHPADELAAFERAADQFDYRKKTILDALADQGIELSDIDAFSGYCGAMGPTVGGIFAIDQKVCDHVLAAGVNHPATLGAPLLYAFARQVGRPAFAVNQPDTDELADVARITGWPGVYRKKPRALLKPEGVRHPLRLGARHGIRGRQLHRRPRGRRPFGGLP